MLGYPFMQRALVAGLLVGFLASYVGPFVVQRGLGFLGSGLAHAAFGGVALGLWLQTEPLWIAVPFTVAVALAIVWVRDKTPLRHDTAIGIFFAVSMAFGIILLYYTEGYAGDAFGVLFGSLLTVKAGDIAIIGVLVAATVALFPYWGRWAYATFDPSLAKSDGIQTGKDDYILSAFIAVIIVVSIKVVGILLIAAFPVIPAAAARLVTKTFSGMTLLSVALGMTSAVAGLWISYAFSLPPGPAIILFQAGCFFVALILGNLRNT
ncbi:MAG: zinc ABC transporter permease [Candidatus Hydrogenedentota bacterium]